MEDHLVFSSHFVRWRAPGALLGAVAWIAVGVLDLVTRRLASLEEALIFVALLGTLGGIVGLRSRQAIRYEVLGRLLSTAVCNGAEPPRYGYARVKSNTP